MKLIRRKKDPTPVQEALRFVKLSVRALVAARMARNSLKHYRRVRRLPLLLGGAAILALVAKLLKGRGGSERPAPQPGTPPASSPPPAPAPAASSPAPPAAAPSNGAPNPVETAGTGTPEPTDAPEPPPTAAADGP